jgi:spore coat protein U-like protein
MKKLKALLLFLLIIGGATHAATTGSFNINAIRAVVSFITVPISTYTGAMNDSPGQLNTWNIGDVVIGCNKNNWTVTLASLNSGYLTHSTDPLQKIAYTVTFGSLVTNQALTTSWTSGNIQKKTAVGGNAFALSIAFTASGTTYLSPGTYTDTLTITTTYP